MKVKLDDKAFMPCRAHEKDSGLDLRTPYGFTLFSHSEKRIKLGVHVQIPEEKNGFPLDATIEGRSSINALGIIVQGLIDNPYRGSIEVNMINPTGRDVDFERGDKIAQLVIRPVVLEDVEEVETLEELGETDRGEKGFGSTGR